MASNDSAAPSYAAVAAHEPPPPAPSYAAMAAGGPDFPPDDGHDQQKGGGGEKPVENGGKSDAAADSQYGFGRSEMNSQALVGSVGFHERHLFLSHEGPETWPPNVENDDLPHAFLIALKARKKDFQKAARMTVFGGDSSGEMLVFPDMLRYKGLAPSDSDSFVEDVLVNGKEWGEGAKPEPLSGIHVFVCCHGSRDKRCGVCGPALIEKLQEEIQVRGLEKEIFVRPCSHIGGHKYAGNLIVFGASGAAGKVGHWYGYVSPEDIPLLLDQHVGKGEIVDKLWRGQMGLNEENQKQAQQSRLSKGGGGKGECPCNDQTDGTKERNGSACCQTKESKPAAKKEKSREAPKGAQQVHSTDPRGHDGHLIFPEDDSSTDEEAGGARIKLWGGYSVPLPKWFETWEREDTHAVLAVVGAAATVAIAYQVYKRQASG